ncbi:hypothetical protein VPH35_008164 [Triticum aestivum]
MLYGSTLPWLGPREPASRQQQGWPDRAAWTQGLRGGSEGVACTWRMIHTRAGTPNKCISLALALENDRCCILTEGEEFCSILCKIFIYTKEEVHKMNLKSSCTQERRKFHGW